jgi:Cytochrome c554 and c-prime
MPRHSARPWLMLTAPVFALMALLSIPTGPGTARAQPADTYKFTGAASCGSSNCHGVTKPKADYPKLDESIIWADKDKHAKAFDTLTNEKLKSKVSPSQIAQKLKIAKAETSDRCLSCHAVNAKPELRGPKFAISEGVHCDGCHGPAEKWLEQHDKKGWTHEQSVKVGMYDTRDLLKRAEKCVSCHLAIDHELVSAGHPDLAAFELDTFSALMPPHWRNKGTWFGTATWATGQAVNAREAMKQLAARAGGNAPEKRVEEAWTRARASAIVFRPVLALAAPEGQKSFDQEVSTLGELLGKPGGDRAKIVASANQVAGVANQVAAKVAAREFDEAGTLALMKAISGDGTAVSAAGLRAAEQSAMALDRLYNTYSKSPAKKADSAAKKALDDMFKELDVPSKFDATRFGAAMKTFNGVIPK